MGCAASVPGQTEVTMRGVSLEYLQQFVSGVLVDHGPDVTIAEVVQLVVRPRSAARQCCFFELVPLQHRGKPSAFISHTWSRKLSDLFASLRAYYDGISDNTTFVWLDIIAINQHPYELNKGLLSDDVSNLARVIQAVDKTLFVLDPQGVVLTRIWCLFEIWQTLLQPSTRLVILPFEVDLEALRRIFNTMSVSSAQATLEADRTRILEEISQSYGGTSLDLAIKQALVDAAKLEVEAQEQLLQSASKTQQLALAAALSKYGGMLSIAGRYAESEPLLRRARDLRSNMLGPTHLLTLSSALNLGSCLQDLASYEEAWMLAKHVATARQELLGAAHLDTLAANNNMGSCLLALGKYKEAEELFRQVLMVQELSVHEHPGSDSTEGLRMALTNLMACLQAQGRYNEALSFAHRAVELAVSSMGDQHPSTLACRSNQAAIWAFQGDYEDALQEHLAVLAARGDQLGEAHPTTADSHANVGGCLRALGRVEEALAQYQAAEMKRATSLGPSHPHTLTASNHIGVCLDSLGRAEEAAPIYLSALATREAVLGPMHPDTLQSVNDLAFCLGLRMDGREQEAEPLFQRSLAGRKQVLGTSHPDTLASSNNFAVTLKVLGRHEDAVSLLQTTLQLYDDGLKELRLQQQPGGTEPAIPAPSTAPLAVDPNHMRTMKSLAGSLKHLGRSEEAVALMYRLCDARNAELGQDHPISMDATHLLGTWLDEVGRHADAEVLLHEVLALRLRVLGEEDDDTQDTLAWLAGAMEAQGKPVNRVSLGLPSRHLPKQSEEIVLYSE